MINEFRHRMITSCKVREYEEREKNFTFLMTIKKFTFFEIAVETAAALTVSEYLPLTQFIPFEAFSSSKFNAQ